MSKSIRLYALLNKPEQKAVVTIDATATWESLWTSLEKALGASLKEVLSCTAASYTKAPREIKMDNKSATMSQLGLADGMTLKLTAPVKMIRPASIKAKEEKEEEKSDKDASKEEKARARYESAVAKMKLTSENVFKKLAATFKEKEEEEADRQLLNGKGTYDAKKTITLDAKQKTMLQFIDENFGSIVLKEKDSSSSSSSSDEDEDDESKGRLKKIKLDFIPLKMICEIYKRDTLSIENEMTLLQVGLAWADQRIVHLTKAKKAETSEVKSLMQPVLPHIRFPLFSTTHAASVASLPVQLFSTSECVELVSYCSLRDSIEDPKKRPKIPNSFSLYKNQPRTISSGAQWTKTKMLGEWTLSEHNKTATIVVNDKYAAIALSTHIKSGVWELTFEFPQHRHDSLVVGVLDATCSPSDLTSAQISDYAKGWGCASNGAIGSAWKYQYSTAWPTGMATIVMTVDMKEKKISWFCKELSHKYPELSGLPSEVIPAVSTKYGVTVKCVSIKNIKS
eukprot:TRINITY_DN139_c0_g1_i7.p1 TRINITY_DN139_c0_g1~~TRINITY_DN139_c0_g1_i7.p1  ORF type:complete len:510 (+),score=130.92 TRINITY_DN139_c0_g1_i7:31-1560(+)